MRLEHPAPSMAGQVAPLPALQPPVFSLPTGPSDTACGDLPFTVLVTGSPPRWLLWVDSSLTCHVQAFLDSCAKGPLAAVHLGSATTG